MRRTQWLASIIAGLYGLAVFGAAGCKKKAESTPTASCAADPAGTASILFGIPSTNAGVDALYVGSSNSFSAASSGACNDWAFKMDNSGNFNTNTTTFGSAVTTYTCGGRTTTIPSSHAFATAIRDVGAVCGLGAVSTSGGAGTSTTASATAGHGYVFTAPNGTTYRMYVSGIRSSTSGGIYGPDSTIAP